MRLFRRMWSHYGERKRESWGFQLQSIFKSKYNRKLGKSFFMTFCFSCGLFVCCLFCFVFPKSNSHKECTGNGGVDNRKSKQVAAVSFVLVYKNTDTLLLLFIDTSSYQPSRQLFSFVFNQLAIFSCLL